MMDKEVTRKEAMRRKTSDERVGYEEGDDESK